MGTKIHIDWSAMTQATFAKAVRSAVPDLKIFAKPFSGRTPEGQVPVAFHLQPTSHGVLLSIRIGEDRPHRFWFSSEEDAAAFIGRVFAAAK